MPLRAEYPDYGMPNALPHVESVTLPSSGAQLASGNCYAAWVLIVRQGKEPIVKRCNTDDEKRRMMTDCRNQFPMSQIISLQTNPGDPKELWAESLVNYMATVNVA